MRNWARGLLDFQESSPYSDIHAYGHVDDADTWTRRTEDGGRWRKLAASDAIWRAMEKCIIRPSKGRPLSKIWPTPFWISQIPRPTSPSRHTDMSPTRTQGPQSIQNGGGRKLTGSDGSRWKQENGVSRSRIGLFMYDIMHIPCCAPQDPLPTSSPTHTDMSPTQTHGPEERQLAEADGSQKWPTPL